MPEDICFEDYPVRIVIVSNLLSLIIYTTGTFLVFLTGLIPAFLYILFIAFLEFRLLSGHCVDCYYYGKTCAFGKGKLSSLIFSKGIPERFSRKKITYRDMIPDLLVVIIPVLAGIVALIIEFQWIIPILIAFLLIFVFFGNAFVRGNLACRYCKQREMGCPAAQLFGEKTG